ncbi:hypothetical protein C1645_822202 [Glomus cerebriforme]|uniref:Uncharacterized protein n=1 Tax=Glomus cerebriforme TaxID=658196 RepID=A0A397SZH5_9GLOM|nr:hypothetical protein C1645_822202 [Glomus cerebriforme]
MDVGFCVLLIAVISHKENGFIGNVGHVFSKAQNSEENHYSNSRFSIRIHQVIPVLAIGAAVEKARVVPLLAFYIHILTNKCGTDFDEVHITSGAAALTLN